ncbi:hypothetical protein BHE74_00050692, partial [Ensete ventricosum]
ALESTGPRSHYRPNPQDFMPEISSSVKSPGFVPEISSSTKSSRFVPEVTFSAKSPEFAPEITPRQSRYGQLPSPCSVGSTHAQSDQVHRSVESIHARPGQRPACPRYNLTAHYKTSSSAPKLGASRRSSRGGRGNDMTDVDLAATSLRPWTVGPTTRHAAHLTARTTEAATKYDDMVSRNEVRRHADTETDRIY